MTSYEFQASLYRTRETWLDAISEAWLSAGGNNSTKTQLELWSDGSAPEEIAAECVSAWWGENDRDEDDNSPIPEVEELAAALVRYVADLQRRVDESEAA